MDGKKCYILFCDEKYYYLMRNALVLLDKFSEHKVIAYTINFLPTETFKNVTWERINDYNLLEYQATGKNDLIKNNWDKTMYSCFMKASAVCESLNTHYEEFVYLDVDTFPTKNIDNIFSTAQNMQVDHPILSRYHWEYMMYGGKGSPFTKEGYDETRTLEWWLLKELGLTHGGYERDFYKTSCFFYYNKNSRHFWEEAARILASETMFKNQNEFFGDESVINVLLWKYKYKDFFNNERAIHINNGDQLDTPEKIDRFFYDLENTESGPPLVINWNGESQLKKFWMFHGKVSKFFNWKENILNEKKLRNVEESKSLNDYFVHKISCAA